MASTELACPRLQPCLVCTDTGVAYGDSVLCCLQVNLENGTLDQAVQALKGAPRGMVRILVAKPLALPEIGESSTDDVVSTAPPFSLLMLFHGLIFLISWPKHGGNFLVFLDFCANI